MRRNLIVFRGASSYGKTATLNCLSKTLASDSKYKVVKSEPHPNGYDQTFIASGPFGKVGIITFGDPGTEEHVDGLLKEMEAADATVIFAASRTRGQVWNGLIRFASENDYNLISTAPMYSDSDKSIIGLLNDSYAIMLKDLAEKLSNHNPGTL